MRYLSSALRQARETAGLSREQVAVAVRKSVRTIQEWERGATEPDASDLGIIAGLTGRQLDYFFNPAESSETSA